MPRVTLLWDASGLVKRYLLELGSETVDAVFAEAAGSPMTATPWGYLETYAILHRRHNAGAFNAAQAEGLKTLNSETLAPEAVPDFFTALLA